MKSIRRIAAINYSRVTTKGSHRRCNVTVTLLTLQILQTHHSETSA